MALITQALRNPLVNSRAFFSITIGTFCLNHHQRNPIDKAHHVRAARIQTTRTQNAKLLGKSKVIVCDVLPINQRNRRRDFFTIHKLRDRNAIVYLVIHTFIGGEQALIQRRATHLRNKVINRPLGQRIILPRKMKPPLRQCLAQ